MDFVEDIKKEFPIFNNNNIVYLDSAASAQKPKCVIDAELDFYSNCYANVHRGAYALSISATNAYEDARGNVRTFLNAKSDQEIIFTRGATESINLIAHGWGRKFIREGDEIVVTILEHHSNFVPWQRLCDDTGAILKVVELGDGEDFSIESLTAEVNSRTKLVAVTQLANGIGLELPVKEIAAVAHKFNALCLVDGAQSVPHEAIDVIDIDCDFFVFSGHKIYGPTGIGVAYIKKKILSEMDPYQTGGDMIRSVSINQTIYNDLPYRFEAGTPNIVGAVGMAAAINFIRQIGYDSIITHEKKLTSALEAQLYDIEGVRVFGPRNYHHGLVTFNLEQVHPLDLAQFLDNRRICIRAGHHCAQPLINSLGFEASARISFGIYNSCDDVDVVIKAIEAAKRFFKH